jgi:hypothetical protein
MAPWTDRGKFAKTSITALSELAPNTDTTVAYASDAKMLVGRVSDVLLSCDDFAVYTNEQQRVCYVTAPSYEPGDPEGFMVQWNRVAKIQFVLDQIKSTHPVDQLDALRAMVAQAIGGGLENDVIGMASGLQQIEDLLEGMVGRNAKQVYVATSKQVGLAAIIGATVALVSANLLPPASEIFAQWAATAAIGVLGGSAGALLSILTTTTKEVPFDPMSSADYARFEARTRVLVGALSGSIIAICNKTGVLASSITNVEPIEAGMLLLAIVAGFVERLVPSLLTTQQAKVEPLLVAGEVGTPPPPIRGSGPGAGSNTGKDVHDVGKAVQLDATGASDGAPAEGKEPKPAAPAATASDQSPKALPPAPVEGSKVLPSS